MATVLTNSQRAPTDPNLRLWYYCGIDCGVTREVWDNLHPKLDATTAATYAEERSWQAPAMAMQIRGLAVDDSARRKAIAMLKRETKALQGAIAEESEALSGEAIKFPKKSLAPSWRELQKCFYERMGIPGQRNRKGKVSTDAETLQRVAKRWPKTAGIVDATLHLRDYQKQIESMETGLSPDGRMRASWQVGQTKSGRFSAASDPYGDGTNLQNQQRRLRNVYVPDPGMELVSLDQPQAESRIIAYLSGDENYIRAHDESNVHVEAAKIFFEDLIKWTGDEGKDKEALKKTQAPWKVKKEVGEDASLDLYTASKNRQHGLNFGLTPRGIAVREGIKVAKAEADHREYFDRYPKIKQMHKDIIAAIRATGVITTPLGFRRQFFGRPWDSGTHREAFDFVPQSTSSHVNKRAMLRIWRAMDPDEAQLLQEGHDSLLFQVKKGDDRAVQKLVDLYTTEVNINGRIMKVVPEVTRGPNWRDLK